MTINVWKYPLIYLVIIGLFVAVFSLLDSSHVFTLTFKLPDWLRLVVVLPIIIALASTNLPEFISEKVRTRLKWLHTRPGINQFYYFVTFQVVATVTAWLLSGMMSNNYAVYLFDLVVSLAGIATLGIYVFLMLRVSLND